MEESGERAFWIEFITTYRSCECLWNSKIPTYGDRHMRNKAYQKLIDMCQMRFPDATKKFVVKKIHNLRTCFRRELKKMSRKADAIEDMYVPHLWYFHLLTFLLDVEPPKSEIEVWDNDIDVVEADGSASEKDDDRKELSPHLAISPPPPHTQLNVFSDATSSFKRKAPNVVVLEQPTITNESLGKWTISRNFVAPLEDNNDVSGKKYARDTYPPLSETTPNASSESIKRKSLVTQESQNFANESFGGFNAPRSFLQPTEDDCDVAGKKYACDLRQMDTVQRMIVEKIVSQVIFYGKSGMLKLHHSFTPSPGSSSPTTQYRIIQRPMNTQQHHEEAASQPNITLNHP